MPILFRPGPLGLLLLTLTLPAAAQTLRSGLWDFSTRVSVAGMPMPDLADLQKQLGSLPAEQRQMIEEMLSKGGMSGTGAAMPSSTRLCITPEMAARNQLPVQPQGDCRSESQPRSGNTFAVRFRCSNPSASGEGVVTVTGPDSYQLRLNATVQVQGQSQQVQAEGQGRWLGADCGSVRPLP